jgi:hypothetical protein
VALTSAIAWAASCSSGGRRGRPAHSCRIRLVADLGRVERALDRLHDLLLGPERLQQRRGGAAVPVHAHVQRVLRLIRYIRYVAGRMRGGM